MKKYRTPPGPRGKSGRRYWQPNEIAYLRKHFPHRVTIEVATELGRSYATVCVKARLLGLRKTKEFFKTLGGRIQPGEADPRGGATRFKKGQPAWNKGTHYVAGGRSKATRFRKGHNPANRREVGALRINSEGYLDIKTEPGNRKWVSLHRWNWFQAHGSYPPADMALVFKDGDKHNCELDNLELVTKVEMMRRNNLHARYPKELMKLIHLRGALQRQINKRIRNEQDRGLEGAPVRNPGGAA